MTWYPDQPSFPQASDIPPNGAGDTVRGHGVKALTRVLVALEHQLRVPGLRIPELHPSVFGATHDPSPVRRESYTEDEILNPYALA